MHRLKRFLCLSATLLLGSAVCAAEDSRIEIDLGSRGADVPSSLYGVFFEEISGSGDGGLYAEMVRNRGFEEGRMPSGCTLDEQGFAAAPHKHCYSNDSINRFRVRWSPDKAMTGWRTQYADGSQARSRVTDEYPLNAATPNALRIDLDSAFRDVSAVNTGYWGMSVAKDKKYKLEFYVRSEKTPRCRVAIIDREGRRIASENFRLVSDGNWNYYTATLVPSESADGCTLDISFPTQGTVWLDYVSLFPEDTYKGRPNGLRKDVAEAIEGLHPAFVRWPGGCIVEGLTLDNRVKWKETIGKPVERPGEYDLWGYRSTYGFGYHEFLQFCEDIGADGMFVCNAGMSCLFRNGDYVQGEELEPLIQEALDAIEYAVGDAETTKWGAERARNGHPEPFPLRYVEVGNENVFWRYAENYNRFHKAIKARYPQIELVTALMFSKDLERLDDIDIIDPHYYETADWFYNNADVYDKLPSRLPYKIYIGEYAATGRSNLYSSLAEAAFLTGVERNADKVQLVSYAPLLQHSHYGCGHLIVFDNKQTYGRTNYHIVKLFNDNRPDYNVRTRIRGERTAVPFSPKGSIGLATQNSAADFKDIKVVSGGKTVYSSDFSDLDSRWSKIKGEWKVEDGMLRQPKVSDAVLRLDNLDLGDCTITLKARKTNGGEGFRVIFGMTDRDRYFMADMGSHSNESVLFREVCPEKGSVSLFDYRNQMPILKNKWYDVRIDIRGNKWKCYLDGKLAYEYDYNVVNKHYAVAGIDKDSHELVVKMVNARNEPWETSLDLKGGHPVFGRAVRYEISSPDINAENSFDEPEKIVARESTVNIGSRKSPIVCAPNSVTVLRVPLAKE